MKKFLLCACCIGFLSGTSFASAHVLQTNGSIGAVLHIDPDDDPIAGQVSTFFFEFKDKANKFKLEKCACLMHVWRAGQEISAQPLALNTTVIFPAKDVYLIKVTGSPVVLGQFQPFELNYDIRVDREAPPVTPTTTATNWWYAHTIHFLGAGFLAVLVPGLIIRERLIERKAKKRYVKLT